MEAELMSFSGLVLMFVLGLRHGLDPDHIACIDGLTWQALHHKYHHARWIGTLFAAGHGLLVTVIAVAVSLISEGVRMPDSLVEVFNWVPTVLLLMVGTMNLKLLLTTPQFRPTGWKIKLLPEKLRENGSPLAVIITGVLFATVFDTATQASAWGYVATNEGGGMLAAFAAGIAFTIGMVITDTIDGQLICNINRSAQSATLGQRYRRVLGWMIVIFSYGVAGYNISIAVIPTIELSGLTFTLIGAGLFLVMILMQIWMRRSQSRLDVG